LEAFWLSIYTITKNVFDQKVLYFQVIVVTALGTPADRCMSVIKKVMNSTKQCIPDLRINYTCYSLPENNPLNFFRYNKKSKKYKPHYYSIALTETVRIMIPDLFPHISKFIYFDTDLIINRRGIIEELWNVPVDSVPLSLVSTVLKFHDTSTLLHYYSRSSPMFFSLFPFPIENNSLDATDPSCRLNDKFLFLNISSSHSNKNNNNASVPILPIPDFNYRMHILCSLRRLNPNNGVLLVNASEWRVRNITGLFLDFCIQNKARELIDGSPPVQWDTQSLFIALLHKQWGDLTGEFNFYGNRAINYSS